MHGAPSPLEVGFGYVGDHVRSGLHSPLRDLNDPRFGPPLSLFGGTNTCILVFTIYLIIAHRSFFGLACWWPSLPRV